MSGSIRLFVAAPLLSGAQVPALPGQAHYLAHVMRRRPGDEVHLFNGADGEWRARIATLSRDTARLHVLDQTSPQHIEPDLWLCFALLKRDATDLVVEKATELGVSRIIPVLTERTQAARVNLERLSAIAVEAAEQSERLTIPVLQQPIRLPDLLAQWPANRHLVVAMERILSPPPPPDAGALLVGPEGGFAQAELDALRRHAFVSAVTLGPRILRAETAAIAGLVLLLAHNPQT